MGGNDTHANGTSSYDDHYGDDDGHYGDDDHYGDDSHGDDHGDGHGPSSIFEVSFTDGVSSKPFWLLVVLASDMCCFYMPAQWMAARPQWAAGEKVCHVISHQMLVFMIAVDRLQTYCEESARGDRFREMFIARANAELMMFGVVRRAVAVAVARHI